MKRLAVAAALFATLSASTAANAVVVAWTDWTSATNTVASGTITNGATTYNISLSTSGESLFFVQTGAGTDYFTQPAPGAEPYTSGDVSNAPPAAEMVALGTGGIKTINFGQLVTNPYIAFVSWNGNVAAFDQPFEKVSEGCGYWGCGTFSQGAGNTFVGSGEVHGVLRFLGTFSSISFTDSTETWHGLTVGIDAAANAVPEPATWTLMIGGFGLAGTALRRRRAVAVAA